MKFERGNKVGHGGKRPGAGRPTKAEVAGKQEMLNAALDALKMSALKAVLTLAKHLESADEAIAVRAATAILDFTLKAQVQELDARIGALEAKINQGENHG